MGAILNWCMTGVELRSEVYNRELHVIKASPSAPPVFSIRDGLASQTSLDHV